MSNPINVFIPAAGKGSRLQPISGYIAKPLLPIIGTPILGHILQKLPAEIANIGINLHYQGEKIANWLQQSAVYSKVVLYPESTLLNSGGALKNAADLLSQGTFLVHNADILSSMDLDALIAHHRKSGNLITLTVCDAPLSAHVALNLALDVNGFLLGVGASVIPSKETHSWAAFASVAVYEPEFLQFLPSGISAVTDAWNKAIAAGYAIGTVNMSSCYWNDIGTPLAYMQAVLASMQSAGRSLFQHPSAEVHSSVVLKGYVVMEAACSIAENVTLENTIVLPDSRVEANAYYRNSIVGPGFVVPLP
jgi:mannose-1-phosphate guanylyltransferase